jgi:hypothetical protein
LVNYSIVLTGAGFAESDAPEAVSLGIQMNGENLTLSWPAGAGTEAYILQQAAELPATSWSQVPGTPTVVGNLKQMTVSPSGAVVFYRLYHP